MPFCNTVTRLALQPRRCGVFGDPWVMIFDGAFYGHHGTCRVNLIKPCGNDWPSTVIPPYEVWLESKWCPAPWSAFTCVSRMGFVLNGVELGILDTSKGVLVCQMHVCSSSNV